MLQLIINIMIILVTTIGNILSDSQSFLGDVAYIKVYNLN